MVQTLRWLARPLSFLDSCRRRYGDAFSLRFVGFTTPMVVVSEPQAIQALYTASEHGLPPGRTAALRPIMGPRSILLLEGSEHIARRRMMLPPFHGERMRAYAPVMREIVEREIASWPVGREFAIHPRMQAVTLEVILRVVFGVDDLDRRERLRGLLQELLGDFGSPRTQLTFVLSARRGSDPLARLREVSDAVDELLFAQIAERRSDSAAGDRGDVLSLLLAAHFEDGEPMSDSETRDHLITLLLAGHETTATALAWTFDMLLHNPATLTRLTAELQDEGDIYLRAVIAESLRLRPVVPLAGRRLASELRVNGLTLPEGTDVTPAIWLTHTRANAYPDPFTFRPERFLDDPPETYSWIPFGGGVRRCLGAAFAEAEMRIVLSAVLSRCELRPATSAPEKIARRNITLSPRDGTRVVLQRRN